MEWALWLVSNLPAVVGYLIAILTSLIGIAMLIPGDEPEATFRKIIAIIEKFSLKK